MDYTVQLTRLFGIQPFKILLCNMQDCRLTIKITHRNNRILPQYIYMCEQIARLGLIRMDRAFPY